MRPRTTGGDPRCGSRALPHLSFCLSPRPQPQTTAGVHDHTQVQSGPLPGDSVLRNQTLSAQEPVRAGATCHDNAQLCGASSAGCVVHPVRFNFGWFVH